MSIGAGLLAFLAWAGLFHQFKRTGWKPSTQGERALCLVFLAAGLVFTLSLPPVSGQVSRWVGLPHFGTLLLACTALFGAWTFYPFVEYYWEGTAEIRNIVHSPWLMIGACGAVTVLYGAMVRAGLGPQDTSAPVVYLTHLVFIGYLGLTAARMCQFGWRSARFLADPAQRDRARVFVVGWAAAVATNAHAALHITAHRLGLPFYTVPDPDVVTSTMLVTCVTILSSGVILDAGDWLRQYHEYRALGRLWRIVYGAMPQIALFPPAPGREPPLIDGDINLSLYRRVIEILDGLALLRPYARPAVVERAASLCGRRGIAGTRGRAILEAAALASALQERARGTGMIQGPKPTTRVAPIDLPSEVAFLREVDRAFRRSPIVVAALGPQRGHRETRDGAKSHAI